MEGSFNGTLEESQETQNVESQSEYKEVIAEEINWIVDFGGEVEADDKSRSVSEPQDGDASIFGNENGGPVNSGKVEETEDVSESDNVEFESNQKKGEDSLSPEEVDGFSLVADKEENEITPSEENLEQLPSVVAIEGSSETEAIETIKDLTNAEEIKTPYSEENSASSLPPIDAVSEAIEETTIPISDESDKVPQTITEAVPMSIEESRLPDSDEKVGESSDVDELYKENANECMQPLANVPAVEATGASVQDKTDVPRSIENPTNVSVTQRQYTSWGSCCGLLEILRRGDR